MARSFSGEGFAKALTEENLREEVVREGMAKSDTDHADVVLFTEGTSCSNWIKIPVKLIERVEYLGMVNCKDHEHPFIRLHLKDPPSDNHVAQIFSEFARQSAAHRETTQQGECRFIRGPCVRNPDGTYTRTNQLADCSEVEVPCTPPSSRLRTTPRTFEYPCDQLRRLIAFQTRVVRQLLRQLQQTTDPAAQEEIQRQLDEERAQLDALREDFLAICS